ncbi:MAG: translesion error-prone DNA polymerase V autoproteolytic subunit [Gammaproteobacteria bacterium]
MNKLVSRSFRDLDPFFSIKAFLANQPCKLPLYGCKVAAGFPSPADDHLEGTLDLNEYLIHHPAATFFVRAKGHSMVNAGIHDNDILIVDRSLEPSSGRIVIAVINGELTVKRLIKKRNDALLLSENPDYPPLTLTPEADITLWGVVIHVIHPV